MDAVSMNTRENRGEIAKNDQRLLIRIKSLQISHYFHILGAMNTFEWIFVLLVILGCVVRVAQIFVDYLKNRRESGSSASEWHNDLLRKLLGIIMIVMLVNIVLFVIN